MADESGTRPVTGPVLAALEAIFDGSPRPLPLHAPSLGPDEIREVQACVESGWVSYLGSHVAAFEAELQRICGCAGVVSTCSGTAALHLALLAAGVGRDDEVLMPPLSFVATANAAAYLGAVPHFVDIEATSLGVCAQALQAHLEAMAAPGPDGPRNPLTGRRIAALAVVHAFGHPADLDALADVCARWGLPLVEDAAEALGSLYKGRHVGRHGLVSALSFNGNKIVTTGGGGAVFSDDAALIARVRHTASTAKVPHPWESRHDEVGFNYRMPALNAALGLAQARRLDDLLERKRALAQRYAEAFSAMPGVRFLAEPPATRSNFWLNTLVLEHASMRDGLLAAAREAGFALRPAWELLCDLPMYAGCPRAALPRARDLQPRLVNLPSSPE